MKLLLIRDVAIRLNVSQARAYALVRRGSLPGVYLGKQVRVDEDALRRWIEAGGKGLDCSPDGSTGEAMHPGA